MGFPCSGDLALKSWEGGSLLQENPVKLLNRPAAVLQLAGSLGIYGENNQCHP